MTRRLLTRTANDGLTWVEEHALFVASDAQRMYSDRLRPRSSHATKDAGEDEAIALLAFDVTDGVLVTMDGKAALSALVELGPNRVVSPFDCWEWLQSQGFIDGAARAQLDARSCKSMGLAGCSWRFGR